MEDLAAPPILSTPDTHIFEPQTPISEPDRQRLSDESLDVVYEIERTIVEIRKASYRRIALQFPDDMLVDAPRVYRSLSYGLGRGRQRMLASARNEASSTKVPVLHDSPLALSDSEATSLFILGDTSYSPCCVDEIAAEHANADVVVHYGRACLSPTARIPAIYVFTERRIQDEDHMIQNFVDIHPGVDRRIILMADVMYQSSLSHLSLSLRERGYSHIHVADIERNPASPIPNRKPPQEVALDPVKLKDWHIFHVSEPPQALLMILNSRVASCHIYPTSDQSHQVQVEAVKVSSIRALSRRYALLTSVSSASIIGILVNTLSVKQYEEMVDYVKTKLQDAGRKSYTFVVGKLNSAKLANFSEVDAWVVIGCWESSLIDSRDLWKPVITPFELDVALQPDDERTWTGEWSSDFRDLLDTRTTKVDNSRHRPDTLNEGSDELVHARTEFEGADLGEESAPPDFDLRKGTYVSRSRPMRAAPSEGVESHLQGNSDDRTLAKRSRTDLALVGGMPSPAAEYLRTQRTWKGLGSDFKIAYDESGSRVEEGRSGIARGYDHPHAEQRT